MYEDINTKKYNVGHFKIAYKNAYDGIMPDKGAVDRIAEKVEEQLAEKRKRKQHFFSTVLRPVAATVCVLLLLSVTALPVMAKSIPAVYNIIAKYAPALADFVLPEENISTSAGITMQVEAINVEGKDAQILVSFSDAEGSGKNLIKGKVDLYDSYHLRSYGAVSNIGGCSFLEYDEAEDKAYFEIAVTTFDTFDKGKLTFSVSQLLTNKSKERRQIDLGGLAKNPATRDVTLNGCGGMEGSIFYDQYLGNLEGGMLRNTASVLDMQKIDESMIEALTVTGVAYSEGVLRVQVCRGNFAEADRHARLFLVDSAGNEQYEDFVVGWQEEVKGEQLLVDEHWFLVDEEDLENLQLYGDFYITEGSVEGDWEVTLKIE